STICISGGIFHGRLADGEACLTLEEPESGGDVAHRQVVQGVGHQIPDAQTHKADHDHLIQQGARRGIGPGKAPAGRSLGGWCVFRHGVFCSTDMCPPEGAELGPINEPAPVLLLYIEMRRLNEWASRTSGRHPSTARSSHAPASWGKTR